MEMDIESGYTHYDHDQKFAKFNLKSVEKLEEMEAEREKHSVVKEGALEFKNVSAKYLSSENYVTKNLSLKVAKGKKIGIVGRTGSGKSTLVKLLWRYLDPEKGEILIDGINISSLELKDLRRSFNIIS